MIKAQFRESPKGGECGSFSNRLKKKGFNFMAHILIDFTFYTILWLSLNKLV